MIGKIPEGAFFIEQNHNGYVENPSSLHYLRPLFSDGSSAVPNAAELIGEFSSLIARCRKMLIRRVAKNLLAVQLLRYLGMV